ncbi:MAG: TrkA family potassium uptake protein [Clostridiales bacterium]|nr:TrkA family potassium uptake protein [Clostridiales bacterium]
MKNRRRQFLVVGLGRFGCSVAETLCEAGEEVLGIDRRMDLVEDMRDRITQVVQADAMERDALSALGVQDFDVAFVTMGSDIKASGTITMLLKDLGVKKVIAKASDEFHGRMLEKLGADKILFPERDMGRRIAHNLVSGNIIDYLELSPDFSMAEILPDPAWVGKSLKELDMRTRMGVNVVAIRNGETLDAMPSMNTVIHADDVMLVVSSEENLNKLKRMR